MFWCVNDVGFFQQTTNHECRTTEVAESRLGHTWYFHVLIFQHVLLNVPRALRRTAAKCSACNGGYLP